MATGTAEFIDLTTAAVFVPTIWSQEAIIARQAALLFAEKVNRVFEKDVLQYGNTIHVPSVSNLTVQAKNTSANAATIFQTITETNTDITIGTWEYQAIAVETAAKRQVNRDLLSTYAGKQGYALGKSVDGTLSALVNSGLTTNVVGTYVVELTYENFLTASQQLDDANVPAEDRVVIISPAQKGGVMKLDQFVNRDYEKLSGETEPSLAAKNAYLGKWMDLQVYFSTQVNGSNAAGHDNTMLHKEALALVLQMKPVTHDFFDINFFAYKVAIEQLYGTATMRADHGVNMKGA